MTQEQNKRCQAIIHTAAGSCSAVGFASSQIPGSDNAIMAPIQITMIISLGGVFGVTIDKSWAKSLLGSFIATITGRALSQALVGWIPGLGNVVNAGTAAALTEAIGWAVAKDLENADEPSKRTASA
ncbi:MAG: hypothetical protein U9N62_06480 [Thermotogota bacterium]|nr:hypothetical protein [Thermotogota bacterium]